MTAHYLYRCYQADGRLLYVGETKNAISRCEFHARNAFWGHRIERVTIKVYPNRPAALAAEKRAIHTERPRFNNQGRWVTRREWTDEDFTDYIETLRRTHSSVSRDRVETCLELYASRFGHRHPQADTIRREMTAENDRREREWAKHLAAAQRRANELRQQDDQADA